MEIGEEDGPGKIIHGLGIAVSPNGDIGVASSRNSNVCVYSEDRNYKFSLDTSQGIEGLNPLTKSLPQSVTVNADGVWYVTDGTPYVKMFSPEGVYKGRWMTISPDERVSPDKDYPFNTKDASLCGLTIDSRGEVLVGQLTGPVQYVSRHRGDGTHISSFEAIWPHHLAVTPQNTIVIGRGHNHVEIVDFEGHALHTLNADKQLPFWEPRGVYCHDDIIMVCNIAPRADLSQSYPGHQWYLHVVSCFSLSAEYLGSIDTPDCRCPTCFTIAKNCKLLVSHFDKIYVYSKTHAVWP